MSFPIKFVLVETNSVYGVEDYQIKNSVCGGGKLVKPNFPLFLT